MPRSHLFTLQARRASVRLAHMAQALEASANDVRHSRDMLDRLGILLGNLSMGQGPVTVAQLRDIAHLSDRLGAEHDRQNAMHQNAEARAGALRADMRDQMRKQQHAQDAAATARWREAEARQNSQDAARPPLRNARWGAPDACPRTRRNP